MKRKKGGREEKKTGKKIKGEKKRHMQWILSKVWKKRGEQKNTISKKKKKRNEATTERKDGVWKRVWKGNKTSTVTRKEERKRSENKKKIL